MKFFYASLLSLSLLLTLPTFSADIPNNSAPKKEEKAAEKNNESKKKDSPLWIVPLVGRWTLIWGQGLISVHKLEDKNSK